MVAPSPDLICMTYKPKSVTCTDRIILWNNNDDIDNESENDSNSDNNGVNHNYSGDHNDNVNND